MGADGGVNWIKVKDPKNYSRMYELTAILQFWDDNDGIYENYHSDWLAQNSDISAPDYLVGLYGSFRGHNQGAEALRDIIQYEDEREQVDLTFEELWLDLITREDWKSGLWARTNLENFLWESFGWSIKKPDYVLERLGHLRTMLVGDWLRELRRGLSHCGSAETWT